MPVVHWEQLEFEYEEQSKHSHAMVNLPSKTLNAFVQRIPPGVRTSMHRHLFEALVHVLKGAGYTTINGVRHEWRKGSTLYIPPGSWHQHHNTDPSVEAVHYVAINYKLFETMGFAFYDLIEDLGEIEYDEVEKRTKKALLGT